MKVGVIGCGKIAQVRHIPEYLENENSQLVGFCDFNLKRAEDLAKRYGGTAYNSAQELLEDHEIEAVSICVANEEHAKISIQALNYGKHVLCEKPMAMNIGECRAMVEAAGKNGRQLMIGQSQRFAKAHVKAKELLSQGAIGDVLSFRTIFGHSGPENWGIDGKTNNWFFDKTKAGMGAMADLGIHKTDLIQFLLDQKITAVQARLVTLDKRDSAGKQIEVDDNAVCIYTLESGAVGTMSASWTYYGAEDNSTVIYGTEGMMKIYADPEYSLVITTRTGEIIKYVIDQIQTNANQTRSGVIDAFVEALVTDREVPASGREVLQAMKVVFACVESAKTGQQMHVE